MDEYNREVGKRLKEIRLSFNEGVKLSANQFAHLLGTTRDKIANYESGRTALPASILYAMYNRGINPVYIISGEASIYANNEPGRTLKEKIDRKNDSRKKIFNLSDENYKRNREIYKVAAGKIIKK